MRYLMLHTESELAEVIDERARGLLRGYAVRKKGRLGERCYRRLRSYLRCCHQAGDRRVWARADSWRPGAYWRHHPRAHVRTSVALRLRRRGLDTGQSERVL